MKYQTLFKQTLAIATIIAAILITVTPAGAITFGEPDGNRHPNVGLILADFRVIGTPTPRASGTLISPTIFLVAGHTLERLSRLGFTKIWVAFDSEFDPATSHLISAASWAIHPDFSPDTLFNDVGVVILSEPVPGVTPAVLPSENLLDQMKAAGTLRDQTFVNVGYGVTADFKGMPPAFAFDGVRKFSTIQALLSRFRGQPVPGSNLLTELIVFMMSAPGYLPRLAWMERAPAYGRVRNALSQAE